MFLGSKRLEWFLGLSPASGGNPSKNIKIFSFRMNYLNFSLDFCRDANEPVPGYEPEPKTWIFGKFSNPVPEPKPRIGFLKSRNPTPNPQWQNLKPTNRTDLRFVAGLYLWIFVGYGNEWILYLASASDCSLFLVTYLFRRQSSGPKFIRTSNCLAKKIRKIPKIFEKKIKIIFERKGLHHWLGLN
jgi:hypothetical protein